MIFVVQAAVILGFPAFAAWALRTGGRRRLWLVSIGCLVGIVVVALTVASGRFGNRLAGPYGLYPERAPGSRRTASISQ
jgi:hypothetical protein